jgi:outer membrane lipoprotein SlyB
MRTTRPSALLIAGVLALLLAACASAPPQMGEVVIQYGRIVRIDPVMLEGEEQLGLGAVLGAAAGGLIGSTIGGGTGRDVAIVLGAIGGGVLGQNVQNKYVDKRQGSHIVVALDNGVQVAVTQPLDPNLRVGDRVMIQGSGQNARVVRA